ncbi:MAG: GNAT family N-acetyltransferase [Clostridiales bacterium]|jgi:predicted GNAT family N-acyltransferase|nr:GNAT family N-acetyltransferase [Clostridiales bacterium]
MIYTKITTGIKNIDDSHFVRRNVFIEEQKVPEEVEFDGSDANAIIVVAYEDGLPVSTARIILEKGLIGRVATLKDKRGKGYGGLCVRVLLRKAFDYGITEQFVHAQIKSVKFYENLGFKTFGDIYSIAGIEHINMKRTGDIGGECS